MGTFKINGASISREMLRLSEYSALALRRSLPGRVARTAKHHLLDTLAAMISGTRLPAGQRAIAYAVASGGRCESHLPGTNLLLNALTVAWAGGMCAHADETDDSHEPANIHPGCAIVPAALAVAEREHRSGRELLRAVVLGYDIACRVMLALGPAALRARGHASHSIGGTFGAAAAAGCLIGLGAREMRYLYSYAAQQASGIRAWLRDTAHVEKAFDFGGMPARNGVAAATMVRCGMTGVDDVFSGKFNILSVFSDAPSRAELTRGLGRRFEMLRTDLKQWSVASPIQGVLDSLAVLLSCNTIDAKAIKRITVTIDAKKTATVSECAIPSLSLHHMVALMLADGNVNFASSHDAARMHDPSVRVLSQRVVLKPSVSLGRNGPPRQALVEIALRDGKCLRHHTRFVRGTTDNPMTTPEVSRKALDLAGPVIGLRRARKLIDAVLHIERVGDVTSLRPLLRPPG